MESIKQVELYLSNREAYAVEQKQLGKKIVGYLSNTVPLEIIHASGAVPLHLCGGVEQEPTLANEYMEAAFDPITRSCFDRILRGDYNFLDLIVLPRCNDSHQRLYYYLREIQRKHPQFNLPPVYLLDLLHTPWPSSKKRNLVKVGEFKHCIEQLFSCVISDKQLNLAITEYNQTRSLLKTLRSHQADKKLSVMINASYSCYTLAQSVSPPMVNELLKEILSNNFTKETKDNFRVVVAGNGLDNASLHTILDSMNVYVVGEYTSLGSQFLTGQVYSSGEHPLAAIAQHYHQDTISSRTFKPDPQHLIDFAKQQKADAILFYFLQGEEALTWQVPKQKACAEKAGIPSVVLYDQNYQVDQEVIASSLNSLKQNLGGMQ